MKLNATVHHSNAVSQLLGDDGVIVQHSRLPVNNHVQAQKWVVNHPEQSLPNQHTKVDCYHVSADEFGVKLLYLQHHFTEFSTAIVYCVHFTPEFLSQWNADILLAEKAFSGDNSNVQISLCNKSKLLLKDLSDIPAHNNLSNSLRRMEVCIGLLKLAVDNVNKSFNMWSVPACSFLGNVSERDKVLQARAILEEQFEQTITIRDLARKVAINECYLKKGFKAMFGKTIHEFQQELRIGKARELLQTDGYTVSDVANILGYSSISHFSTAFKKATNMKPCELLK